MGHHSLSEAQQIPAFGELEFTPAPQLASETELAAINQALKDVGLHPADAVEESTLMSEVLSHCDSALELTEEQALTSVFLVRDPFRLAPQEEVEN